MKRPTSASHPVTNPCSSQASVPTKCGAVVRTIRAMRICGPYGESQAVTYRTSRVFRDQFRVVMLITAFELAEEAASRVHRAKWRAVRSQRRYAKAEGALSAALLEQSLRRASPSDLLPRVHEFLERELPQRTPIGRRRPSRPTVNGALLIFSLAAWSALLAQVAVTGISNRLSFVLSEVLALVLAVVTPLPLLLHRSESQHRMAPRMSKSPLDDSPPRTRQSGR